KEPLRMVEGFAELLDRRYADQLDEAGRDHLSHIIQGAARMRRFIRALLEYGRVSQDESPLEPVDLSELVSEVLLDLERKIEETGGHVSVGALPVVHARQIALHQVFANLLGNALHYAGEAPPAVEITAEEDGDDWVITVSDAGIGIPEAEQERIFESFIRGHGAQGSGSGLGLALSREAVRRLGGDIWVTSTPGEGSSFHVRLPKER
ncbi:MAG: ATP-binding protein, partial [Candidatus Thermoplasmatota archaeon]|nr:ATP-binding protein [Candidatus Thermoplasmatota archaeon]